MKFLILCKNLSGFISLRRRMRHISKAINAHSYLLPESLQVSSNKGSRKEESPEFLAETELASHRRHVSVHESFSYLIHSRLQLEGFLDAIAPLTQSVSQ